MNTNSLRTAMLTTGKPHPSHKGFAESVGADIVNMSQGPSRIRGTILEDAINGMRVSIPDYDILILEGSGEVYSVPRLKLEKNTKIIYLCDDHRVLGSQSYDFSGGTIIHSIGKRIDRKIDTLVLRCIVRKYVNGIITGSDVLKEYIGGFVSRDTPVRTANPYIQPEVYKQLGSVSPNLSTNTAITVGFGRDHKGIDLLVNAWPTVRNQIPDAKLLIVGPGHDKKFEQTEGVDLLGYLKPKYLHKTLAEASLYIHPARAEAFGVTVVEAMRAGLPAIVTKKTGAESAVRSVDDSLIVDATSKKLAERTITYFKSDISLRLQISKLAQEEGRKYSASNGRKKFKKQYDTVVNRIHDEK